MYVTYIFLVLLCLLQLSDTIYFEEGTWNLALCNRF
jgi:hypothetical protein